jgi:hypothetical protein
MKKTVGGCLVVVLIVLILAAVGAYWFVLRPMWNAGSELVGAAQQWAELAQIEQKLDNKAEFTPPADEVIPAITVARFLAVQEAIDARMGDRLKQLEAKYREIEAGKAGNSTATDAVQALGAYGDLFGLIKEAKQTQIDALNAQQFSLAEYRWVRNTAYAALGLDATGMVTAPGTSPAASANAAALAPQRDLLLRTLPVMWIDF